MWRVTKLLGLVGGVSKVVMFASRIWFFGLKRWRAKKFKGTKEVHNLVVLTLDENETGSWEAQSAWNRNSSERHEKSEARHEQWKAQHEEWKARIEKLEELLRVHAL